MTQEYIFRFLSVRPGSQRKKTERAPKTVPVYERNKPTQLATALKRLNDSGGSVAEVLRVVRAFQASDQHVKSLDELPFDVAAGLQWLAENDNRKSTDVDFAKALQELYDMPAKKIIAAPDFLVTKERVSDSLVAEAFHSSWERPTDSLTMARKFIALVEWAAKDKGLDPGLPMGSAFAELKVSIPDFARVPNPPKQEPPPVEDKPDPEAARRDKLRAHLQDLEAVHSELSNKAIDDDALLKPDRGSDESRKIADLETKLSSFEALREDDLRRLEDVRLGNEAKVHALPSASTLAGIGSARVMIKPEAIARLSGTAHRVLNDARIDLAKIEPTRAVELIEEQMRLTSNQLASSEKADTVLLFGGVMMEMSKVKGSMFGPAGAAAPILKDHCHFQAGIGDLLMVKQTLKAYEMAEFAHVENVLAGEARVREHRRLNIREEIFVSEEERETEKERNLQSTERNEMQSEAEKTVKSQFELDAGLQVSGSYGPTISFSASLNVGFSTSSEETQRKAVSYSREVTEKTSERVRERVKKEERRRMLEQVEELNRHSITNEPASNGHVRGIYRWLNKVYDAQILNYGQRMMFEFVVPEPAAYLLYALVENPPKDNELVKPVAPAYYGAPLKPSHLTRSNYLDFVAKYQVRNVLAPPPEFQHVATFDKQDKVQDGSTFGRGTKVDVPAGYQAYGATVMSDYTFTEGKSHTFHVMVGGASFDCTTYWGSAYKSLGNRYKELGIAYHLHNAWSFAIAVEVHCRLTSEGFAKWQQAAFDSIMEAYLVQKAQYEEAMAALAIQQGVKILGRNPLENRRIEREELKKLVLMMLMRNNNIARNSILPGYEPNIDLQKACLNGSWIRFFENAFEWNNLMYVLYPYFWGRKARWISALHFTDPDPEFAAFLKAGAGRIQVPVRPGFEKAIAYFCQFGVIWEGNDPPLRDDDLYVPIVDEIAENLGKLDEGVPYPEDAQPWDVRIPTSLVLVQNLEEIPGIKDMLTGNDVVITS
ncbi:hypothetical protein [Lysobacter sp. Root494]|uniref:hypothetical protein n=1 Tax=Lysobacter sp. Root494 TaxID=1736549 RepID=UPI0006F2D319|nr:hypothetical protein [Lysobacter sp. Root494]KQY52619.1 hypothetical protein ASD14_08525 [Lysobacter sp. Root494]